MSFSKSSKTLVLGSQTSTTSTLVTAVSNTEVYYNIPEVAQILHVSERTLYRWRQDNTLPAAKMGRTIIYLGSVLHTIMEQRAKQHLNFDF